MGLKREKELPEKAWSLEIIDEAEDPDHHWKRSDIGTNPRDVFIPFLSKKIGRCRYDEGPCAQSSSEEIDRYDPIPMDMNLSFHLILPNLVQPEPILKCSKQNRFEIQVWDI